MDMKRLLQTIIIAASIVTLLSCEEVIKDGAWDPIELNMNHVYFTSEGGRNVINALNYTSWWIVGGYTGPNYSDFIHATSSEGENGVQDTLDGGWYHLTVPDKCRSNAVIVTVEPNVGEARHTVIQMQAGDAFTTFSISQE